MLFIPGLPHKKIFGVILGYLVLLVQCLGSFHLDVSSHLVVNRIERETLYKIFRGSLNSKMLSFRSSLGGAFCN